MLDQYAATGAIPLAQLLRDDRPVAACLAAVLEEAARHYAADPNASGCMVVEGTRSNDRDARKAACDVSNAAEATIHAYIATRHPENAGRLTDFVSTTMSGLSAKARNGHGLDRLLATARLAGLALAQALPDATIREHSDLVPLVISIGHSRACPRFPTFAAMAATDCRIVFVRIHRPR
ncbi:TetR/AcrR family transcriptional regulator [Sphingomonas sp. 22R3R2A-7]|uniref:TetR/AcrR family transcriptional regulator n=1 Tax=Sphingomonas sp. 22R3R2A-7 TaxID=3050230 RepID=UPI002FE217EB